MGLLDRILGKPERLESVNDQSAEDIKLVTFIKDKVEEARSSPARIAQEGIWMTNIAYLMGYDGLFYDTNSRQFKPVSPKSPYLKKNRVFINKILPTIQNRLARLCKNPPKFDVLPNSSDPDEKDLTRLKEQVLEMIWDQQKLNRKRISLYMWMQQCGHSYIKTGYDAELGKLMMDPETQELSYEGDLRNDVTSAFEVFPDPMAKEFDDLYWLAHAKVRKLDYFRSQYPERGHLVKEEGPWLLSAQYEQRINSLNNVNGAQGSAQTQMKHAAIEIAYYEKRSNKHPNGRLIICANGVLLEDKELPVGEIPFAKFDDVVIGGKYNPESIITHMRPLQDQKNRLLSAKYAFIAKLLAGKYIAAKGAGLTSESLNDQSGEVVEFTPVPNAPPPQAMTPPQMPAYVYQEEQSIDTNFDDIAGINEVSKGQLPAAGIPAIGMQLLTEQDDTRIGVMTDSHEESWARVAKLNLLYAQKFFKTKRLLRIAGPSQEHTVKEFVGDDIQGDHDVRVIPGSTRPGSKTLKRQEILNTWQQGLLGDPNDPKVRENVLSMMEYGDVAEIWKDSLLDQSQAKQLIEALELGEEPQPNEFDNNDFLVLELNRYRKSDKFKQLHPIIQQMFMNAMNARLDLILNQVNPAMAADPMQQAVANGPPVPEAGPGSDYPLAQEAI